MRGVAEHDREPNQLLTPPGAVDHAITDMTVTFAADVTLAALQAQLAPHAQWLPVDGAIHTRPTESWAAEDHPSLGELVLRNSTGPLRLGFGAWRDVLLGAQFVNGRGELISVGGRVLKNVAGYDVTKLLVGSHGIFGSVVSLTARTWRRPAGALHVEIDPRQVEMTQLIASPLRPQWAVQFGEDSMMMGYLGDEAALEYYESRLPALNAQRVRRRTVDDDAEQRHRLWPICMARARVFLPPDRLDGFVARPPFWPYTADRAFGVVISGANSEVNADRVMQAAQTAGATAAIYSADGMLARTSLDPVAYQLLQRLKRAFDPDDSLPALPTNEYSA